MLYEPLSVYTQRRAAYKLAVTWVQEKPKWRQVLLKKKTGLFLSIWSYNRLFRDARTSCIGGRANAAPCEAF